MNHNYIIVLYLLALPTVSYNGDHIYVGACNIFVCWNVV